MEQIERNYIELALKAVVAAFVMFCNTSLGELKSKSEYGKGDTKGYDAIPEIHISDILKNFNSNLPLITEETAQTVQRHFESPEVVFIADPTDRSSFLGKFLGGFGREKKQLHFIEILKHEKLEERWERECHDNLGMASVSGSTSAVTGILRGRPFFSVVLNHITKEIFLVCEAGARCFQMPSEIIRGKTSISLNMVLKEGRNLSFTNKETRLDEETKYSTFLGKSEYIDAFQTSDILSSEKASDQSNIIYREPGGPSRVLYLSSLCEKPVGFILANGEKIIEWIHWLPYLAISEKGYKPLRAFQIFPKDVHVKKGMYMAAAGPHYSIIKKEPGSENFVINTEKLLGCPDPAKYREALLITYRGNRRMVQRMMEAKYRELFFEF